MSEAEGLRITAAFNGAALAAYQPQPVAGNPWADYWYCYINDPEVGYFKIAFMSYLNARTGDAQHAYLHIAFFPLGGGFREYDFHCDRVTSEAGDRSCPYSFHFEVPGAAIITQDRIELTLPEASIVATVLPDHKHYWNGCNPANGPFTPETDGKPRPESHWFIFTLGTPTHYAYHDARSTHHGRGTVYIERGWSSASAPGFTYLVATGDKAKLMLVEGGISSGRGAEAWAGKILMAGHELQLLPLPGDHRSASDLDSSRGAVSVELEQLPYRLVLKAQATLRDFYDQVTPSQTVFGSEFPVMKTMNAALDIALYRSDVLVESLVLPQSILEFAGAAYCPGWRERA